MSALHHQAPTNSLSGADSSALCDAERLAAALALQGIATDVHDGYGLALVSVWVDLVVWCNHERYWWRVGWDEARKRVVYAWHPATDPLRAANRIARRYAELQRKHSVPCPGTAVPQ